MSTYNNKVAKIAEQEQKATVQKELGKASGVLTPTAHERLKNIVFDEYYAFIEELFESAFYKDKDNEECNLRKSFKGNEDDIIPIFREMIGRCINEQESSKPINPERIMGSVRDEVRCGNKTHYVVMKMFFIPAKSGSINKFRFEVVEKLKSMSNYPFIKFSVDIDEDGSITYNKPSEVNINHIVKPAEKENVNIKISKHIEEVRDVLVDLFNKVGIKKHTREH